MEQFQAEVEKERARLALHIKTALSTASGIVLLNWLKENCFMTEPSLPEYIDSPGVQQRLNARRDLFIMLQTLLDEGAANGRTDE